MTSAMVGWCAHIQKERLLQSKIVSLSFHQSDAGPGTLSRTFCMNLLAFPLREKFLSVTRT